MYNCNLFVGVKLPGVYTVGNVQTDGYAFKELAVSSSYILYFTSITIQN